MIKNILWRCLIGVIMVASFLTLTFASEPSFKKTHKIVAEKIVNYIETHEIDPQPILDVLQRYTIQPTTSPVIGDAYRLVESFYQPSQRIREGDHQDAPDGRKRKLLSSDYDVFTLAQGTEMYQETLDFLSYYYELRDISPLMHNVCVHDIAEQCYTYVQLPKETEQDLVAYQCRWSVWVTRQPSDQWMCPTSSLILWQKDYPFTIWGSSVQLDWHNSSIYKASDYMLIVVYGSWGSDPVTWNYCGYKWEWRQSGMVRMSWEEILPWSYCYHFLEGTTTPDPTYFIQL